jgi:hypothetical protein
MRKFTVLIASIGLAATSMTISPFAAASTSPGPTISGTATRADGSPFSRGAPVALFATARDHADSAVGRTVESVRVATSRVGASGAFELIIEDIETVEALADESAVVDFEVRAVDRTALAPYSISRKIVHADGRVLLADPAFDQETSSARAATTEPLQITGTTTIESPLEAGLIAEGSASAVQGSGAAPMTQVCGETKTKNLGTRRVLVGATYAMAGSTTGRFTYKAGASSSLGVAYSASGRGGTWSRAGTTSRSSTAGVSFGSRTGGNAYSTYFTYGQYAQWCRPLGSSKNNVYNHVVKANGYAGGSHVKKAPVPSAKYCTPLSRRDTVTRKTTTSNTWSNAVNFSGPLGVNLTAKTGWSSSASMSYTNNSSSNKRICGTHGYWGGTPIRAVTK